MKFYKYCLKLFLLNIPLLIVIALFSTNILLSQNSGTGICSGKSETDKLNVVITEKDRSKKNKISFSALCEDTDCGCVVIAEQVGAGNNKKESCELDLTAYENKVGLLGRAGCVRLTIKSDLKDFLKNVINLNSDNADVCETCSGQKALTDLVATNNSAANLCGKLKNQTFKEKCIASCDDDCIEDYEVDYGKYFLSLISDDKSVFKLKDIKKKLESEIKCFEGVLKDKKILTSEVYKFSSYTDFYKTLNLPAILAGLNGSLDEIKDTSVDINSTKVQDAFEKAIEKLNETKEDEDRQELMCSIIGKVKMEPRCNSAAAIEHVLLEFQENEDQVLKEITIGNNSKAKGNKSECTDFPEKFKLFATTYDFKTGTLKAGDKAKKSKIATGANESNDGFVNLLTSYFSCPSEKKDEYLEQINFDCEGKAILTEGTKAILLDIAEKHFGDPESDYYIAAESAIAKKEKKNIKDKGADKDAEIDKKIAELEERLAARDEQIQGYMSILSNLPSQYGGQQNLPALMANNQSQGNNSEIMANFLIRSQEQFMNGILSYQGQNNNFMQNTMNNFMNSYSGAFANQFNFRQQGNPWQFNQAYPVNNVPVYQGD